MIKSAADGLRYTWSRSDGHLKDRYKHFVAVKIHFFKANHQRCYLNVS